MKNKHTQAITFGGIFTSIYVVVSLISIYVLPALAIIFVLVSPIFCTYYATKFSFKETFLFNLSTFLLCFIFGIGDPFFAFLYVLPTLIIGDVLGLLNHLKIKVYFTIFLQSITFFITNLLTFYLAEVFYDIKILSYIIADKWLWNHLLLCIVFILSSAEAIISYLFIQEQLKKLKITKQVEEKFPLYGYFLIFAFYFFTCLSFNFFINLTNLFNLFIFIFFIMSFIETLKNKRHKTLYCFLFTLFYGTYIYIIYGINLDLYITVFIPIPILIYSIVKLSIYIYNINKKRRLKYE